MTSRRASAVASRLAASVVAALLLAGCTGPAPEPAASPPPISTVSPGPTVAPAPTTSLNDEGFATSGWTLRTDVLNPFYDRIQVDVDITEIDDSGLALYREQATGKVLPHPIVNAQYAMAALLRWEETGDDIWLTRAIRNAQELVDTHVERDGAWWFQYDWDWTYLDRTLTAPWWSGMAQGEALTVFSRLAAIQPENPQWRQAADRTVESFFQRGEGNTEPWATVVDNGYLWFEEYAGDQPPLLVMNGHVFAIFGLYEYWLLSGDQRVATYIDGGATAILTAMPLIRGGEGAVSYYCTQRDYCRRVEWQNATYHPIHIQQLHALGRITGAPEFDEWAALLESDWQG
ncbi:D-glucuronyl C5-epimerase family protein [Microbacterium sp. A8/3-1]|uniref:D-glucuronyl C5-epimerase family protein n=1 Tax=Microbacterium sp. A8/3-1 TaxID=3160749 RepID=A0AAU7VZ94_9MICO